MHETLKKFSYPESMICEYAHWVVLLRPKQVTLGCLVLVAKSSVTSFPELTPDAFTELQAAVKDIETVLRGELGCDKINYLMLMMVDPQVHFHVIPRYQQPQVLDGITIADSAWPKPPDLQTVANLPQQALDDLQAKLKQLWPTPSTML